MTESTVQLSKKEEMDALLAEIQLNKEKESLKQDKANTTQIKIHSELYEQVSKLNSQTDAVKNVKLALDICVELDTSYWADDAIKKQAAFLLKDALKRARVSYK